MLKFSYSIKMHRGKLAVFTKLLIHFNFTMLFTNERGVRCATSSILWYNYFVKKSY